MNAITELPQECTPERLSQHMGDATRDALQNGKPRIDCLQDRCGLPAAAFTEMLGQMLQMPVMSIHDLHHSIPAFDVLPYAEAVQRQCVLLRTAEGRLLFSIADPFDANIRAWGEERITPAFEWCIVHRLDLMAYLSAQEETMRAMDTMLAQNTSVGGGDSAVEDLSIQSISEDSSTVVKLVNSTLYDALKAGASDIHLETTATALIIKYRIDGVLSSVGAVSGAGLAEQVVSRIKVMSELDIAERRVPQDGRFKVSVRGREIDFRVSIMPSIMGEDAVLRILDKRNLADQANGLRLDTLGFEASTLEALRRLCNEPYGMVLVTGPTGSGKTTSLYAAVSEINHGRDKIITIEDPVEYQLPGVLQIPVNEKKGLTFARGLRSILRHDPDKILVGEIRDAETAQIAIQAALTGHLVFTTVHANSVFDVIGRFTHMGVDPYSFVSALNGVMAQRLVRLNCQHCAEPESVDALLLRNSNVTPAQAGQFIFRAGRGCSECRGTGFRGRSAIAEMLLLSDQIRELIIAREPISRIKAAARANGTRTLRESAMELVCLGKTSLREINRVTLVE
jgi:general secretion pathway protein E